MDSDTWAGIIVYGGLVLICLGLYTFNIWFPIQGLGTTSGGRHTGFVTAVEDNKLLYHSTLVYFKTNPMSTQEDRYCLGNQSIKGVLEAASMNQSKVTVDYGNDLIMWKWDCWGGESIITGVVEEEVNRSG